MEPAIQFTINQPVLCENEPKCNKLARFQIVTKREIDIKTNVIVNSATAYCPEHSPIKFPIDELKQKEREFKSKYMKRQYLYIFKNCDQSAPIDTTELTESEYKTLKETAIKDLAVLQEFKELN